MDKSLMYAIRAAHAHPYSRYGLAVASFTGGLKLSSVEEQSLRGALIECIETSLSEYRLRAIRPGVFGMQQQYEFVSIKDILNNQAAVIGKQKQDGYFGVATILIEEATMASKALLRIIAIIKSLKDGKSLTNSSNLQKGLHLFAKKRNFQGTAITPPKATFLEEVCALIAAITPHKVVPVYQQGVFPDLSIDDIDCRDLVDFISLASDYIGQHRVPENFKNTPIKSDGVSDKYIRPSVGSKNVPRQVLRITLAPQLQFLAGLSEYITESRIHDAQLMNKLANCDLYTVGINQISVFPFNRVISDLCTSSGRIDKILSAFAFQPLMRRSSDPNKVKSQQDAYGIDLCRFLTEFTTESLIQILKYKYVYGVEAVMLLERFYMEQQVSAEVLDSARAFALQVHQSLDRKVKLSLRNHKKDDMYWHKYRDGLGRALAAYEMSLKNVYDPSTLVNLAIANATNIKANPVVDAGALPFAMAVLGNKIPVKQAREMICSFIRIAPPKLAKEVPVIEDDDVSVNDNESNNEKNNKEDEIDE